MQNNFCCKHTYLNIDFLKSYYSMYIYVCITALYFKIQFFLYKTQLIGGRQNYDVRLLFFSCFEISLDYNFEEELQLYSCIKIIESVPVRRLNLELGQRRLQEAMAEAQKCRPATGSARWNEETPYHPPKDIVQVTSTPTIHLY